ncbi:AAA family ATPase [Agrobacterium pusense]|uniref:AAA family ATPase n=1 Tax=Agrobacterium pusense TaxID=648995 RepID=UPI001F20644E|nr:AAA family ATPase [Agrobacterium pusense]
MGRRQVGKATSASNIGESRPSTYLDLEPEADWAKLAEPELYLASLCNKLVIRDEVHRLPNAFQILRGLIDRNRPAGRRTGEFLLLGYASIDLKQSGEALACRIAYPGMQPVDGVEVPDHTLDRLWSRRDLP